jgi:hypothetical protein
MTDSQVQEKQIESNLKNVKNNSKESNDLKKDKEVDDWDSIYDDSGESIVNKFEKVLNLNK